MGEWLGGYFSEVVNHFCRVQTTGKEPQRPSSATISWCLWVFLQLGALVQKQLRHSDPRITLAVYAHVLGDQQRTAVQNRPARLVN